MSIAVQGNYTLNIKFGDTNIPLNPTAMDEFTIIQDMNRFLPYFRLRLMDSSGIFTHVAPFDKGMSRVSVQVAGSIGTDIQNAYSFVVYRRFPESMYVVSNHYDVGGLLDVSNLFNPSICRAFVDTIGNVAAYIAINEMGCDDIDISQSLMTLTKKILQPRWTNAQLFKYWKRTLGDTGGYCYMPFIKVVDGNFIFTLRSLSDMMNANPEYKFIVGDRPYMDYLPVTDYTIFDNYKIQGIKGVKTQEYFYFDYNLGELIDARDNYEDYVSLSDFITADIEDSEESITIQNLGRTNEFTETFVGNERARYYRRINDLTKMWIYTWGLANVVPGQVAQVLFAQGAQAGNISAYQYSGNWLIERVVHSFGSTFSTKLLLKGQAWIPIKIRRSFLP
jgi:hypothetical protein